MTEVMLGSAVFVGIVLILALAVLVAQRLLMPSGPVNIKLNGGTEFDTVAGRKLLTVLEEQGIRVPSACGGAGTCGQCKVKIIEGSGPILSNETSVLSRSDVRDGQRLACQVTVRGDMTLALPAGMFSAQEWDCEVASSCTVAPLMREIVLNLPDDVEIDFTPGAFVQVTAPEYSLSYSDYEIADEYRDAWDKMGISHLTAGNFEPTSRAYSIANTPEHGRRSIVLLIRLALPPPDLPHVAPGIVSSWLFGRKAADRVTVSGPFGEFAAQDTGREMVFIGGGVGMAPLRAIITDLLAAGTTRKMSFWYGARSGIDLFYKNEFDSLAAAHSNFFWTPALSDPAPQDDWAGDTGFIHDVAYTRYLKDHPAPENCEYYLCGPPLMIRAVVALLDDLGVDADHIFNDDFGS